MAKKCQFTSWLFVVHHIILSKLQCDTTESSRIHFCTMFGHKFPFSYIERTPVEKEIMIVLVALPRMGKTQVARQKQGVIFVKKQKTLSDICRKFSTYYAVKIWWQGTVQQSYKNTLLLYCMQHKGSVNFSAKCKVNNYYAEKWKRCCSWHARGSSWANGYQLIC